MIARFTLVEITSAASDKPAIQPWAPGSYEQPGLGSTHKLLGVTMTAVDFDQQVAVMRRGYLRNVVRQNSETWSIGDILWAKSDGSITNVRPTAPLPLVVVGTVFETIDVLHTVDVDVRVLPSMGELSGVTVETPVDTDVFVYDSTSHCWVPRIMFAHAPGPTGQPNDGEVLYWDTTNKQALGSADFIFNDTLKSIILGGDVYLYRDAAGVLAQRNGANAQEFRVYNTYTNASNYERGGLTWYGNTLYLLTEKAGTGTNRGLFLQSATGTTINVGSFRANADAANALGDPSVRWGAGYFGGIAATVPMTIKAHASQTANLQEWQNSSGTALTYVDKDGYLIHSNNVAVGNSITGGQFRIKNTYVGVSGHAGIVLDKGSANAVAAFGFLDRGTPSWDCGSFTDGAFFIRDYDSGNYTVRFKVLPGGQVLIPNGTAATIPLVVKAHASQTANLQEWQNSSGTALAYVQKGGAIKSLGLIEAVVAKTANYTATINDHVIKCDASGGAFTITLPAAASFTGMMLHIKKTDSSANRVTIDGNASELVEDAVTQQLIYQGENLMLQCDGTQWWVL